MNSKPILPKHVDTSKISYQPPKKNQNGGKSILVSYGGERLVLQLPVMYMPYGVTDAANIPSKPGEKKAEPKPPRYVLDLSFRGKEENKAIITSSISFKKLMPKLKRMHLPIVFLGSAVVIRIWSLLSMNFIPQTFALM